MISLWYLQKIWCYIFNVHCMYVFIFIGSYIILGFTVAFETSREIIDRPVIIEP